MTYRPASWAAAYMRATGGRMKASQSGRPMMRPRCWPQSSPNQTASTPYRSDSRTCAMLKSARASRRSCTNSGWIGGSP